MKKGDKVRSLDNVDYLGVSRRHVGVVISQHKYKLPKGSGSIHPDRGWDVEVKFRHKFNTVIFQGEQLKVVGKK